MSTRPSFTVEYLEPVASDAEPLPDEFSATRLRRSLLVLAAIVLVVVAAIVLVPGLGSLRDRFMGAQPGWLALAAVLQLGSCASYVLVFRAVFCRRMSWRTSSEIGLSELAANSVFSIGGAGGLALGAWILRRGGLEAAFIAHRTVAFFLLTSLANVGFLALGGVALATGVLHGSPGLLLGLIPAVAAVVAITLVLGARRVAGALERGSMRARLAAAAGAVGDGVDEALRLLRTGDPAILAGAAGYMLFDVAMLGVCFAAFGNDVPPAGVLLVDRLPRAAALDPGAARAAGARRPAPPASGRGARHRRLRARGVGGGARPRLIATARARHAHGRLTVSRTGLTTAAAGTSARPRSTNSSPLPARPSG